MGHHNGDDLIAGRKTKTDWAAIRPRLEAGDPAAWEEAFTDFFHARLRFRYLDAVKALQSLGRKGEGFAITAILCTLIEFLESTAQGKTYRFVRRPADLKPFEYNRSGEVFVEFLSTREPFANFFDVASAEDFYENVRCPLLHEARTRNGWRIRATSPTASPVDTAKRVLYRDQFQDAVLAYIDRYKTDLFASPLLKEAFIRKFDSLCV